MTEMAGCVFPNGWEDLDREVNEKHAHPPFTIPIEVSLSKTINPTSFCGTPLRLIVEDRSWRAGPRCECV